MATVADCQPAPRRPATPSSLWSRESISGLRLQSSSGLGLMPLLLHPPMTVGGACSPADDDGVHALARECRDEPRSGERGDEFAANAQCGGAGHVLPEDTDRRV